jgi:carboxylesterase
VIESAYPDTPLAPLLSLLGALADLQDGLKTSEQPLLLLSSPQDHVVVPEQADHLAAVWGGPVQRVILERSFHVATLDHDAELVQRSIVAFAQQRGAS